MHAIPGPPPEPQVIAPMSAKAYIALSLSLSLSLSINFTQHKQSKQNKNFARAMAQEEKNWEAFAMISSIDEEDDALSLCDLPETACDKKKASPATADKAGKAAEAEEFEFRTWGAPGLCTADELFFQGQILPLRPSISSESGGGGLMSRSGSCRSFSSSSRSSSSCISRSQSSNSCSSIDAPRVSVSNNFYAHPSPSPQLRRPKQSNAARKSTGSPPAGWVLLRLGVAKTPEIELNGFRPKRAVIGMKSIQETKPDKNGMMRFLGFGCKCSPEAVAAGSTKKGVMIEKKKKKKGEEGMMIGLKRGEIMRRRRIFEWLEELSMAKATVRSER